MHRERMAARCPSAALFVSAEGAPPIGVCAGMAVESAMVVAARDRRGARGTAARVLRAASHLNQWGALRGTDHIQRPPRMRRRS